MNVLDRRDSSPMCGALRFAALSPLLLCGWYRECSKALRDTTLASPTVLGDCPDASVYAENSSEPIDLMDASQRSASNTAAIVTVFLLGTAMMLHAGIVLIEHDPALAFTGILVGAAALALCLRTSPLNPIRMSSAQACGRWVRVSSLLGHGSYHADSDRLCVYFFRPTSANINHNAVASFGDRAAERAVVVTSRLHAIALIRLWSSSAGNTPQPRVRLPLPSD